jgi:hypothetical protein
MLLAFSLPGKDVEPVAIKSALGLAYCVSGGKDASLLFHSILSLHQIDNEIVHKKAMNNIILSPASSHTIIQREGPAPHQEQQHIEK